MCNNEKLDDIKLIDKVYVVFTVKFFFLIKIHMVMMLMTGSLESDKSEPKSPVSMPSKGNRSCSAPNCSNFRGKVANLSFFKFPKDVER